MKWRTMAKNATYRWRDWRINEKSGQSIRADDKQSKRSYGNQKKRIGNGWWWTLARRVAHCNSCTKRLAPRDKIAYNHGSRKIFCPNCARVQCVAAMCKPSKSLQRVGDVESEHTHA
jgi:hypothetical protein